MQEHFKDKNPMRVLKETYYAPFYNMLYKSLVSPEGVCEFSAQNTPHIIYYISLKMPILSGSINSLIFERVSLNPNELQLLLPFPE